MPSTTQQSTETQSSAPSQEPSQNAHTHKLGESAKPQQQNGDQKQKPLSRYERTKRQRAEIARREATLQQRERQLAEIERQRERQLAEIERARTAPPKRDYTLGDLQKYRRQWESEGNYDLVEKADKEIAAMQAELEAERQARTVEMPPMGSPEHRAQWEAAERELYQADPEFMRAGTRLDTKLRQIMNSEDGNVYRGHPRGIIAAYHRAKMELLEADKNDLLTRFQKLEEENKRLNGLTSLSGGTRSSVGNGSTVGSVSEFAKLSTKDMRKHLLKGANRGSTPWF
jgi:hypothetical protein